MSDYFSGNTKECAKDYLLCNEHGHTFMSKFTGACISTVLKWKKVGASPQGRQLLKLQHFLATQGYKVDELERLSPFVVKFGKLIAFGLISLEEAAKTVGYSDIHSLLKVLLRGARTSREKEAKMRQIVKERQEIVAKTEASCKPMKQEKTTISRLKEVRQNPTTTALSKEQQIEIVASLVNALLPFANIIASDLFSPEERKRLREQVGNEGVFTLSTHLNRLCSETAYKQFRGSKKGELNGG